MAKFVKTGDTIEAEHTNAHSRKIEWKGPRRHPITNELMMLYECDRNSFAEVVKECTDETREETAHFHRCLGDKLEADGISVYIKSKRKTRVVVDEGVSARHGAQFIYLRERNISTIKTPLSCLRKCLGLNSSIASKIIEKK